MTKDSPRIGLIGAGQMALAMAHGFVSKGGVAGSDIIAADPSEASLSRFAQKIPGAVITADNHDVVQVADVLILAVKPQMLPHVAKSLGGMPPEILLISIAAGVKLARLCELFDTQRVIRVMPNTPCLVGMSACGFAPAGAVDAADLALTERLLGATGLALQVPENQLDAVTGLSGSGPAFIYMLIEAMSDAGVQMGLPRGTALQLAAQTVKGGAEMVLATGEHPAVLKDQVTSPGGTTIAGVRKLEEKGFRSAIIEAIVAASGRSRELGGD